MRHPGKPHRCIQARTFRTFQIAPEYQEQFGYPAITPELRRKVFGLNAARPYKVSADETRREFLNLLAWKGGDPA